MFPFLVHKIFTFYTNGVLNCKCPAPGPKGKPELFKYAIVFLSELDGIIWYLLHIFNFLIPSSSFRVQSSTTKLLISNSGFPHFFPSPRVMNETQRFPKLCLFSYTDGNPWSARVTGDRYTKLATVTFRNINLRWKARSQVNQSNNVPWLKLFSKVFEFKISTLCAFKYLWCLKYLCPIFFSRKYWAARTCGRLDGWQSDGRTDG